MIVLGVNEVCCGCDLHAELSRVAVEGSLLRAEAQGLVPMFVLTFRLNGGL